MRQLGHSSFPGTAQLNRRRAFPASKLRLERARLSGRFLTPQKRLRCAVAPCAHAQVDRAAQHAEQHAAECGLPGCPRLYASRWRTQPERQQRRSGRWWRHSARALAGHRLSVRCDRGCVRLETSGGGGRRRRRSGRAWGWRRCARLLERGRCVWRRGRVWRRHAGRRERG